MSSELSDGLGKPASVGFQQSNIAFTDKAGRSQACCPPVTQSIFLSEALAFPRFRSTRNL